ncbi:MAG: type I methionyl aminopeptidase [Ruminococcaceae bacterium]|nr:type I methionyl aminopeptidase [Oscillospiraceae bacterium]
MIIIKSKAQVEAMRKAGSIAAGALALAGELVTVGISTYELDTKIREFITSKGARPSFLGYDGYPGSACISINSEVIHGIPSKSRIIKDGDIVSIDVGANINGVHGDCANTFFAGNVSDENRKLVEVTRQSFFEGINYARQGCRIGDIGYAIDSYVKKFGYSTVKRFVGHGIGQDLHEAPEVPNFGSKGRGVRLTKGMTIAVEPMINAGSQEIKILSDKWTVVTADGKNSAHYENTILITDNEPEILTKI